MDTNEGNKSNEKYIATNIINVISYTIFGKMSIVSIGSSITRNGM